MIDISELEQYFPAINKYVKEGPYTFRIILSQNADENIFVINLKINQDDTKEGHLIKFKIGIGKDKKSESKTHESHKPHFEIEIYKREKESFSANVYFTFDNSSDKMLFKYAKGTIFLISKIIENFLEYHSLNRDILDELIFSDEVNDELSKYESVLIDALYDCYQNSTLTVRDDDGKIFTIKTIHNLSKYLDVTDLKPLYLSLLKKAKE